MKEIQINMSETKQISNAKPEQWYNEYYDSLIKDGLDDYFLDYKEEDKMLDIYHRIDNFLAPFNEQMHEAQLIMEPFYRRYDYLSFQERNNKLMSFNEFVEAKEQHSKAYENVYHNIPSGVSEEEFNNYHRLIRGKLYRNLEIIFNYNTLEKNAKFLEALRAQHNDLKKERLFLPKDWKVLEKQFTLCEQAIKKGYLITNQLDLLNVYLGDYHYCLLKEKERKCPKNILDIYFKDFSYTDEHIFNLIRKNVKWHDIERDLAIFQERQKGKYLKEIAETLKIKLRAVSMVIKKVQGAINYWKGKLFEDFVLKRLKESELFEKVILDAGKGESDIRAYKDDKLYIYSLKNLKIDRKPYWLITKEELLPELKASKLCSLDYDTHLTLLVYDNHHKEVKQIEIDYDRPENIDLSK